jgi:hypothetical protein
MKKTIVTLTCMLITLLAFAQAGSNGRKQGGTSTESVAVTGTIVTMTTEDAAAASYQPIKTLVVREAASNSSRRYVLNGPGRVVNKAGEVVQTAIKPGTRVSVYYVTRAICVPSITWSSNSGRTRRTRHVFVPLETRQNGSSCAL